MWLKAVATAAGSSPGAAWAWRFRDLLDLYFPAFVRLDEVECHRFFLGFAVFIAHFEGNGDFGFGPGSIGVG
ncbi:hypothetical protein FO484_21695, partial [Bacillus atrophaeus ATCC 9372]